jgi:serine phosphatase RsbU (regulator of sigma subunit)
VIEHEWLTRQEVEELQAVSQDIEKAAHYIKSLLPQPLAKGPVLSDWVLLPSARLGGDAFGYRWLTDRTLAIYMIDVAGNGAGAAMHSVSVLSILGRGALPVTDFNNPANVLETLNVMFESRFHGGLSVSVWYGVYDTETRRLRYGTAGHHPAILVPAKRDKVIPLETDTPEVGVKKGYKFKAASVGVPPQTKLYVFSDGAFEFTTKDGNVGTIDNMSSRLLRGPVGGRTESMRLLGEMQKLSAADSFEDDFALMAFTFL